MNDWSIQQTARLAGTTSRTLRHYGELGLLRPSRVGANGYRYYDAAALVRLQRILLLREMGLALPEIAEVLERPTTETDALRRHLRALHEEQERLARRIASVASTITALEKGEEPMAENMFDGFDHTRYHDEVIERWGEAAYADADRWWRGLDAEGHRDAKARVAALNAAWVDAAGRGLDPAGGEAQELAARHVDWLRGIPGTPAAAPDGDIAGYLRGLGEMYVADPRFAANYGGPAGAEFVRASLEAYLTAQR
ncbi:MerR family transcriptional regulator [Microbacterium hominis]|uniref:MerR family transcriptional regulator n=1 Tax=Microbacterium TaxID=33882 RepID=UPI00168AD82F|nr:MULTISPECIES: MerR family transcriptional regulator [Microbacterium]QOC26668.1 MerR family transcriptional regulator [Microbacterium hominis]QOC27840.1 MerR family transcriptional regulator [Microbacterium hominis]QYF97005.1 MerR family transcriptional regulator [Microbacterium sp. PAMC21962]